MRVSVLCAESCCARLLARMLGSTTPTRFFAWLFVLVLCGVVAVCDVEGALCLTNAHGNARSCGEKAQSEKDEPEKQAGEEDAKDG